MRRSLSLLAACLLLAAVGCRSNPSDNAQPATPSSRTPAQASMEAQAQPEASAAPKPKQTLYLEPDAGFNWLYALVNNARHTLDITMYELVDTTFSADLVSACKRGVRVRVILDQNLEKPRNLPAYTQLNAAGPNCTAAWANPQFFATHQKSLLLDGATAVIMSLNATSRYYTSSRDVALVENDAADFAAMQATFNTDYGSTTDQTYQPGPGDNLIWSPTTAQPDLVGMLNGAKKTLFVENEELGAASIVTALQAACKRGVKVSLAMTDTSINYHANYQTLEAAGCGVHIGANNATTLYIHAKLIVADLGTASAIGYLGSINFTTASMTANRELGLHLHDAGTLQQLAKTITADYNSFPSFTATAALPNTEPARP